MIAVHNSSIGDTDASLSNGVRFNNLVRSSSPFLAARSPTSNSTAIRPLRIMCVDDNLINLRVLTMLIKRHFGDLLACPPTAVDSGLKAIQSLRAEVFDLIFIDIQMPYLSGVECARRIRSGADGILADNTNATICAVTTCVSPDAVATYRNVGMDGLIPKPVRVEQLKEFLVPLAAQGAEESDNSPSVDGSIDSPGSQRTFFAKAVSMEASLASPLSTTDESFDIGLKAETRASLRSPKAINLAHPPPLQRFQSLPKGLGRSPGSDSFKMAVYDESTLRNQIDKEVHSVLLYDLKHRAHRSSASVGEERHMVHRRATSPTASAAQRDDGEASVSSSPRDVSLSNARPRLQLQPFSSPSPRLRSDHFHASPSSDPDSSVTMGSFSHLSISSPRDHRRSSSGTVSSNDSAEDSPPQLDDQHPDDTDSCADTPLSSPPALIAHGKFWSIASAPSPLRSDEADAAPGN